LQAQDCAGYQRDDYQNIRTAADFSVMIIGENQITPPAQFELRCILKREDAAAVLADLMRNSSAAGQMFALTGLMLVAPTKARMEARKLRATGGSVIYSGGCIMRQEKVTSLIEFLEQGLARRVIEPRPDVPESLSSFDF
jgi:hypothetical protein